MDGWHWVVRDASGGDLFSGEELGSREEAEAWMAREWGSLLERGGESVTLVGDGREQYTMGLTAS
ncbi:MAG: hypothetical protein M3333_06105 [Actinomycetota bacterium]|nr:hypothetical protein [Actinomycetota bacterium]